MLASALEYQFHMITVFAVLALSHSECPVLMESACALVVNDLQGHLLPPNSRPQVGFRTAIGSRNDLGSGGIGLRS